MSRHAAPRHFNNEASPVTRMVPKLIQLRSRHPGQLRHKAPFNGQPVNGKSIKPLNGKSIKPLNGKAAHPASGLNLSAILEELDPIEIEVTAIKAIDSLYREYELLDRDYQKD